MAKAKENPNYKVIAENRRARYDYAIEDDLECGIILEGSEVKSLRVNSANIAESYAMVENGELWLVNSYIAPYEQAKTFGHEEKRRRKLLVSKKELSRLWSETQRKGMTLVPLVLYFNHRGIAKLKIGIAKGKKNHDKRETEAKRDWARQKQRLLRARERRMELLIALLTGATAAMIAASIWLSPRLGWLIHAGLGALGGAVGTYLLNIVPATGGDVAYLIRLVAVAAASGTVTLWAIGAIARLLRR